MKGALTAAGILLVLFFGVVALANFASKPDEQTASNNQTSKEEIKLSEDQAPAGSIDQQAKPSKGDEIAVISTTKGDITIRLFADGAPETVKNFTELAKDDKYENVKFHRVIKNFMIQTGDIQNKDGYGGYSYKYEKEYDSKKEKEANKYIDDEFHPDLSNIRGAVSMANSGPDTNGSQFFIVQKDQVRLDEVHSVFGQVIDGMDVVDAIATSPTRSDDSPSKKILIETISIKTYE